MMSRPDHFNSTYTLASNNTYTVNGTTYQTDSRGRITDFEGKLSTQAAKRSLSDQQHLPGKQAGEHAGHLIAASQGGSGKTDNLVRMDGKVNTRDYRAMERENDALLQEGKEVSLQGSVTYPGQGNWPDSFMVSREVTDPATGNTEVDHFSWTNVDMAQYENNQEWVDLANTFPNPGAEQESAYYAELEGNAEGQAAATGSFGPDGGESDAPAGAPASADSFGPDSGSPGDDAGDGIGDSDGNSDGLAP